MSQKLWDVIYVLPNISLQQAFETRYVAIVPYNDDRLQRIKEKSDATRTLLDGFRDQTNRKVKPSALIVAHHAPKRVRTIDCLVAFRNVVAISIILKALRPESNVFNPLFSDFFDFYPVTVSRNDRLIASAPALQSFWSKQAPFVGMTSPYIPRLMSIKYDFDHSILNALLQVWEYSFIKPGKDDDYTRVVFRALEMAYHATTTPIKNQTTIFDFGVYISLWVSALEILAHPQNGSVNVSCVLDLLSKYFWMDKRLRAKWYRVKLGKEVQSVNLIQRLYKDLYDTRNNFLHGNPVSREALYPRRAKKLPSLSIIAPVIFRTALFSYLDNCIVSAEHDFAFFLNQNHYEECLLHTFGKGSDSA